MSYLVDSNVLCRLARSDDPQYGIARQAVDVLLAKQELLVITPQVEREFWVVATRPQEVNGLGMTPSEAKETLKEMEEFFSFRARNRFMKNGGNS